MAGAPPPYSEYTHQSAAGPQNPPFNPTYPAYTDASKGPPGGYPPQPAGYPQYPGGYPPAQMPVPQQPPQQQQTIVVQAGPVATGNCPVCRAGSIVEDFTCCGICLAIFCFPLGLICCLLMKERRCTRCSARL